MELRLSQVVRIAKEPKEHSHCIVCGKVTSSGEYFCSNECEEKFQEQQESATKKRNIFMGIMFVLVVIVIVLSLFG